MHKYVPAIAAAVLAVGSVVIGQAQQPKEMQPSQPMPKLDQPMKPDSSVKSDLKTDTQAQPAAGAVSGAAELQRQIPSQAATVKEDSASKRDLQKVVAQITEAAVTEGKFDQIKNSLAKSDQQRMQGAGEKTATGDAASSANQPAVAGGSAQDLDTAIKDLRRVYKEKYNKDLSISESQVLPQQVVVVAGEVTNPQMLTTWPLRATEGMTGRAAIKAPTDMAQPAGGGLDRAANTGTENRMSQDQKSGLKQGDKIAVLQLPSEQQMPELTASFVQSQGDKWMLDIPDTMDGAKLRQNLSEHIRYITQNKDKLPQEADKASQAIAHHVLMALYDVNMPAAGTMPPMPGM